MLGTMYSYALGIQMTTLFYGLLLMYPTPPSPNTYTHIHTLKPLFSPAPSHSLLPPYAPSTPFPLVPPSETTCGAFHPRNVQCFAMSGPCDTISPRNGALLQYGAVRRTHRPEHRRLGRPHRSARAHARYQQLDLRHSDSQNLKQRRRLQWAGCPLEHQAPPRLPVVHVASEADAARASHRALPRSRGFGHH
eukprot:950984-Rhodomonas_salina.2